MWNHLLDGSFYGLTLFLVSEFWELYQKQFLRITVLAPSGQLFKVFLLPNKTMGEQTPSSIISEYINTNWTTSSSAHLQIWTCECAHPRDNSIFVWPLLEEFVLQPWVPGEQNVGTTQTLTTEVYDHTFTRGIMKGEPSQEPLRWWRDSYEERWELGLLSLDKKGIWGISSM